MPTANASATSRPARVCITITTGFCIRLIESPKERLKKIQRAILEEILNRIPPHLAAHGFVLGRSIETFAAPQVNQAVVLRLDLQDFFPSLHRARIQTIFCLLGYPESVADMLGCLCTNAVPRLLWKQPDLPLNPHRREEAAALYANPHLPQGAPTSPLLANLCAYRMDCRLTGLAHAANVDYSRYADDLAFSGDRFFARHSDSFAAHVAAILCEEGFGVHHRKTRLMRSSVRQFLAGIVVNEKPNLPRDDFDRLKATLHNCVRLGPAGQNRAQHPDFRAHLQGRLAFLHRVNPAKAERLQGLFAQISWP